MTQVSSPTSLQPVIFKLSLCLCAVIFGISSLLAQDTILLNNGKIKTGEVTLITPVDVLYRTERMQEKADEEFMARIEAKKEAVENKFAEKLEKAEQIEDEDKRERKVEKLELKRSVKLYRIEKINAKRVRSENVFSVIDGKTGEETVVYSPDTLGFLVYDVVEPEVDYSVSEMRNYIKGRQDGRNHSGKWSTAGGAASGYVGAILGAFWGPTIPAAYTIILATKTPKVDADHVSDMTLYNDDAYVDGYIKSAKRKKVWNAVIGGVSGLAAGLVTYRIVFGPDEE